MNAPAVKYPEFIPALLPSFLQTDSPMGGSLTLPTRITFAETDGAYSVVEFDDYEALMRYAESHLIYAQREWLEKTQKAAMIPRQVLPYHIFYKEETTLHPRRYFTYQRKEGGGEPRLSKKYSVGVGGHPEMIDAVGLACGSVTKMEQHTFRQLVEFSSGREILEEVECTNRAEHWEAVKNRYGQGHGYVPHFPPTRFKEAFQFLILENDNDVGRIHIALVYLHKVDEIQELACKETLLQTHGFLTPVEIFTRAEQEGREVESWTARALKHIAQQGCSWGRQTAAKAG